MPALEGLINSYYQAWFRFHPEVAVDVGVLGYSGLLTPCDDNDIGALTSLNEKLIDSLGEISPEELDDNERIDYHLMRGAAFLELKSLVERDWRQRDPARFLPVHAIYQLILRQVDDLASALMARLEAIPGHLRVARTHLRINPQLIPPSWLESAMLEAMQGAAYFRELHHHPLVGRYKLDATLDTAARSLEDFGRFMEKELAPQAAGDFACGREIFEMRLRHRHGMNISADDLHALGQQLFDETLAALKAVTRELQGDEDIQALTRKIQAHHPDASRLLENYREVMDEAKAFVKEQALLTPPEREELKVVETPAFLRHEIPFAAYVEPTYCDPRQQGWYYVTPPEDEADLGEHNLISLRHTCVHEAWPGHHLQFVTANRHENARTLPRLLNPSATLYEGWALYCEQLMQEQGFLASPESRFILLKDRLWRALRIMLDVELHTRGLGLEEAAARMAQWLGFSRDQALADLHWYTHSPTAPMGYATGWALITATRGRLQAIEKDFSLKDFHDRLLSAGSIALPMVIKNRFGEPLWESVRKEVFKK